MAAEHTCPECGMELTPGALEGLCPKCMGKVTFDISSGLNEIRETSEPQSSGPAPARSPASVAVRVIVRAGDKRIAAYTLEPGEHFIGRDAECRIRVDVADVSRRHARLLVAADQVQIEDLESTLGTYVGGEQITSLTSFKLPLQIKIASATLDLKQVLAAPPRRPPDEALKGNRYGAGKPVARGGMGIVHEVEDLRLRRVVAMKQMAGPVGESADGLRRFIQEAQILAQLEHSNIMPVHDLGLDAHGDVFYTMKFVRGTTLHQVLCGLREGEAEAIARFPLRHLLTVFQKVCDAVAFAHSKGIIHRDLKPANIMLGEFGEVLVTDWGLAKILSGEDETTTSILDSSDLGGPPVADSLQTMKGAILGTLQFMAPEQAEGRVDALDARTDIYALGGILYNILALRPPVSGSSDSRVLQKIKTGSVEPPTTYNEAPTRRTGFTDPSQPLNLRHCPGGRIPASVSAVAMKALALNPDDRYQTVPELQQEIEAYQSGFATTAEQAGLGRQILLLIRRRKREFALAAAAFVILAGVAVGLFLRILAEKQTAESLLANLQASEKTTQAHLTRLQATAPSFHRLALALIEENDFPDALTNISFALSLTPDKADYHNLQGNIYQSLFRFREACAAYSEALKLDPRHSLAARNLKLSENMLSAVQDKDAFYVNAIEELRLAMIKQGRFREALAIATRLDQKREVGLYRLLAEWQAALKRTGINRTLTLNNQSMPCLDLTGSPIADLSPLGRMPLANLDLSSCTNLTDLRPLEGMPLTRLWLPATKVSDLGPLKGMALTMLNINGSQVSDISALSGMRLRELHMIYTKVKDLSPLRGMPLQVLACDGTQVTDLAPLQGMPLLKLGFHDTGITDLRPLRGLLLEDLWMQRTSVADLSPLAGMPLRFLRIEGCVSALDVSPLAECQALEGLTIPVTARNLEVLRRLPRLKRLGYVHPDPHDWNTCTTAAQFWKAYDARNR